MGGHIVAKTNRDISGGHNYKARRYGNSIRNWAMEMPIGLPVTHPRKSAFTWTAIGGIQK